MCKRVGLLILADGRSSSIAALYSPWLTDEFKNNFNGLRVLALESRRATEMGKLIVAYGGKPMVAPAMREIPLESNTAALEFGRNLLDGQFDTVIFLTGVGTRALSRVVETIYSHEQFLGALRKVHIIARGPKPVAVLKEWEVPITLAAPEPNTWHEILRVLDENAQTVPIHGRRVAVQEYGVSNPDLIAGLTERGAQVTSVPVYEWGLPEDVGPLRAAVEALIRREIDVVLFTTAMQVNHLLQIAAEMAEEESVRLALARMVVASVGPTTSERLREYEISVDFEPSHPKMGYLVSEAALRECRHLAAKEKFVWAILVPKLDSLCHEILLMNRDSKQSLIVHIHSKNWT